MHYLSLNESHSKQEIFIADICAMTKSSKLVFKNNQAEESPTIYLSDLELIAFTSEPGKYDTLLVIFGVAFGILVAAGSIYVNTTYRARVIDQILLDPEWNELIMELNECLKDQKHLLKLRYPNISELHNDQSNVSIANTIKYLLKNKGSQGLHGFRKTLEDINDNEALNLIEQNKFSRLFK